MHAFSVDIGAYMQPRSPEDREERLDLDLSRTNKDNYSANRVQTDSKDQSKNVLQQGSKLASE